MRIVTSFATLMQLAAELGQARLSGDAERIERAQKALLLIRAELVANQYQADGVWGKSYAGLTAIVKATHPSELAMLKDPGFRVTVALSTQQLAVWQALATPATEATFPFGYGNPVVVIPPSEE